MVNICDRRPTACEFPSSEIRFFAWVLFGLLWTLGAQGVVASTEPQGRTLDSCDAAMRDRGPGFETFDCFRAYVTDTQDRNAAVFRVEAWRQLHPNDPWGSYTLGLIQRGSFEEIEALFLHAHEEFLRRGEADNATTAAADLIDEAIHRHNVELAESYLAQAYAEAENGSSRVAVLRLMAREAKLAQTQLQFDRCWGVGWETIHDPAFSNLHVEFRLSVLYAVSSAAHYLGHLEQSVEYAERAVELANREGDKKHRADAALNLVWVVASAVEWELFSRDEAVEITHAAWDVVEASGNPILRAIYLRELVRVASGSGRRESLQELERIANESGHGYLLSSVLANKAVALAEDDPSRSKEAIEILRQAVSDKERWQSLTNLTSYFTAMTRIAISIGDRDQAMEFGGRAMDLVEDLRRSVRVPEQRARAVAVQSRIYYLMADYLLSNETGLPGDERLAFEALERLRGRILIGLEGRSEVPEPDPESVERWGELQHELSDLQLRMMVEPDPLAQNEMLKRLVLLESQEARLRQRALPSIAEALDRPVVELETVQRSLSEDEVLLYFISTPQHPSYLLAVESSNTRVFPLPDADRIFPAIRLWTGLLTSRDAFEAQAAARLGAMLAESIEPAVEGKRKISIVADGPYHRMPFPALSVGGVRLGENYEIQSFPSATYLAAVRSGSPATRPIRALVLADPKFETGADESTQRSTTRALSGFAETSLAALPYSRGEAHTVLSSTGNSGLARYGADASESFLKHEDLGRYTIIHFAAHALLNERLPHRSAVVLAPGDGEDGLLQARDIEGLGLKNSVVVLAACQSAAGDYVRGEGVFSLARSFLSAGAGAVVASRWPIRDDDASQFFEQFYTAVGQGLSVAQALKTARVDAIRRGSPPSSWAGFVVIGNGDQVLNSGQRKWMQTPAVWLLSLTFLAGLGLVAMRRLRRRREAPGVG